MFDNISDQVLQEAIDRLLQKNNVEIDTQGLYQLDRKQLFVLIDLLNIESVEESEAKRSKVSLQMSSIISDINQLGTKINRLIWQVREYDEEKNDPPNLDALEDI